MEDVTFSRGPARRPQLAAEPLIQWATGLPTKARSLYAGWLVEAGKVPEVDDAMGLSFDQIEIKHGSGNVVTHWSIPTANLIFICEGVQSIGEMKNTEDRYGIAFGWTVRDDNRPQSKLVARVLLRENLENGIVKPLQLSLKSTLTGDLLAALGRQFDVLDAVAAFRKLDKKPPLDLPFYAFSIPIGPGEEVKRGSGGQTKEISPPVAYIDTPVTKDYAKTHYIRREWVASIEDMIEPTVRWSVQLSKMINTGQEIGQEYAE